VRRVAKVLLGFIGLFCGYTGLFDGYAGPFCGFTGLFCGYTALFSVNIDFVGRCVCYVAMIGGQG